nr:glycosyltransferase [Planctomycetota bacterium]
MKIQNEMPLATSEIRSRLIFDQYSRYLPTAKVIRSIIGSDESEILDIGSGDECILGQLLPQHRFTFIDPLLVNKVSISEKHDYIAGDIFGTELEVKQFGVVCTVDVLEHIPADFREPFLSKIEELATDLVVLSFPCTELDSEQLDLHMNKNHSSIFGKDYPWLDEHFKYGLPSSTDVELFFKERGWNTYAFGHGHLPWLEEFLTFSLVALDIPVLRNIVFEFSRLFNEIAVDADVCPPFYRRVFIASKKELGIELNEIFSCEKYQGQLQSLTDQLKEKFYSEVLKECKTQSEYQDALQVREQQLTQNLVEAQAQIMFLKENKHQIAQERHLNNAPEKVHSQSEISENAESENAESMEREYHLSLQLSNSQDKVDRFALKIDRLLEAQSELKTALERERYSVVKPVLRRLYRLAYPVYLLMPPKVKSILRKIKQRSLPRARRLFHSSLKLQRASKAQKAQAINQINSCSREGYDVIVFPVIDWDFRFQRPQHLATQLAQNGHRVFYFSTVFADGDPDVTLLKQIDERIFLCQFNLSYSQHCSIYEQAATKTQEAMLIEALDNFIKDSEIKELVSIVDHPFWSPVTLALSGSMVIYDCMDDHSGFNNTASEILQVEAELLKNADLVITTSAALSDKVEETRKNTLIRNAADSNWFSQPPENVAYQSDKPVIGYFGAISEWFDIELVIKAAQAYPEYDFVLIGSTYLCDTAKAKTVPNIHFIGEVPYADLKGYLYAFDVCLIPFKLTDLIYYTNPVKLYEYLAAGKPVVATAMPELLLVKEHVFVAQDTASFISKIQQALESKDDVSGIKSRQEFALKNQWSNRVEKLEKTIESIYPSVSIIVLTYNNLEFTRKCLKSLMEFTNYPNWELVIVDNASSDDSPEFLQTFAKQYDNVKVILNKENVGFSAGNNIGIENSTGEFLVLLNNDTVVTRGWLWDLIRYFLKEKSLGLLGPVTNNIGNEAKISI